VPSKYLRRDIYGCGPARACNQIAVRYKKTIRYDEIRWDGREAGEKVFMVEPADADSLVIDQARPR
jgi:hypothetical protein